MVALESAVQEFLLACQADGLKPGTVRWYRSMLNHLTDTVRDDLESVTVNKLRQYIADLRQRPSRYAGSRAQRPAAPGGLSAESIAGHIRTLHRFFAWCSREYSIANPMTKISGVRGGRLLIRKAYRWMMSGVCLQQPLKACRALVTGRCWRSSLTPVAALKGCCN